MLPFLGFLSNPITKLVADKVIGAASHAMEKKKIIRAGYSSPKSRPSKKDRRKIAELRMSEDNYN